MQRGIEVLAGWQIVSDTFYVESDIVATEECPKGAENLHSQFPSERGRQMYCFQTVETLCTGEGGDYAGSANTEYIIIINPEGGPESGLVKQISGCNGEWDYETSIWVGEDRIPSLNEWGTIAVALMLGLSAWVVMWKRRKAVSRI